MRAKISELDNRKDQSNSELLFIEDKSEKLLARLSNKESEVK